MTTSLSRRDFATRVALYGSAAVALRDGRLPAPEADEVTRDAEAIHQEIPMPAPSARVYAALTDPALFTGMTAFSMVKNAPPASIGRAPGEAFSLFGGQIVGRQIELAPNSLIVQAWRDIGWPKGIYSIARFEMKESGGRTTIVFDHTGFPAGRGTHLAEGWRKNYWAPMTAFLAAK